jgi:hypothetical protein
MSDVTDQQLRDAFAARVEAVAPRIIARVTQTDFQPRRARVTVLTRISAAGGALAAAATAAVLALSGGTPLAFAGWTATPSPATPTAVAAARIACGHVPATDVLVSEARGPYTAIVFVRGDRPWQCVVEGSRAIVDLSTLYPLGAYAMVPTGKVMVPLVSRQAFGNTLQTLKQSGATWSTSKLVAVMTGPGSVSFALGIAGRGVTAVTFTLRNGSPVHATVQHGWYVAWWPGASTPGGAETTRITATTRTGTRSSPLSPLVTGKGPYRLSGNKGCFPGDSCSVLVPLRLTPGIAPSIRRHFAIFTNTPKVNWSTAPHGVHALIENLSAGGFTAGRNILSEVQMQNGISNGLDSTQTRGLNLSQDASMWLVPGTEGYCTLLVKLHAVAGEGNLSESTCGPISELLHNGYIQETLTGPLPYAIGGFVPNGNTTVTIRLETGATRIIAVRHNTFLTHLESQATTITFKNTSRRTITEHVRTSG